MNALIASPHSSDTLIFEHENVRLEVTSDHREVWLSQKQIATLFGLSVKTVNEHIQNIKADGSFDTDSVIAKFRITASDGKNYDVEHYNLDVIVFIGFRAQNTGRTIAFRKWATEIIRQQYAVPQKALTPAEMLLQMAQQLVDQEERLRRIETRQTALEDGAGYFSIIAYYKWAKLGPLDTYTAAQIGRRAATLSKERGIKIGKCADARFGQVNTYHESILREVVHQ